MERIFRDNFGDILRWDSSESNATALLVISDKDTFKGGGCLHLKNVASSLTDAGTLTAETYAMLTEHKIYRLTGELKVGTKTNLQYLDFKMQIYIEGYVFEVGMRLDVNNNILYYRNKDAVFTEVFDSEVTILANRWFTFSIECDIGKARMRSISMAGRVQVINTDLFGKVASTPERTCRLFMDLTQEGTTAGMEAWIDNIELLGE